MSFNFEQSLDELFRLARDLPGGFQSLQTPDGLTVGLMVRDRRLHLQLSRPREYPHELEWQRVLAKLPGPSAGMPATPVRVANVGKFYILGTWQIE